MHCLQVQPGRGLGFNVEEYTGIPVLDLQTKLVQAESAGDFQLADFISDVIVQIGGAIKPARPVVQGPGGLTVDPNAGYAGTEVVPQPGWLPPALQDVWARVTGHAPAPAPPQQAGISGQALVALGLLGVVAYAVTRK